MSIVFSYTSLTCILEHIEANQRIHITSRCSSLTTADKVTPLRLSSVVFETNRLIINENRYEIYGREIVMCFGSNMFRRKIPVEYQDAHIAVRKLIDVFLGGRVPMLTYKLRFHFETNPTIPQGLKFKTRCLDVGTHNINVFLPLLTESSFPLYTLEVNGLSNKKVRHPVLQAADTLIVNNPALHIQSGMRQFQRLTNKTQRVRSPEDSKDGVREILTVMDYWVEHGKDVGTYLCVEGWGKAIVQIFIDAMKWRVDGSYVELRSRTQLILNSEFVAIDLKSNPDAALAIYGNQQHHEWTAVARVIPREWITEGKLFL